MSFNLGGKLSLDAGDFKRSTKEASTTIEDVDKELKALDGRKIELDADASKARGEISKLQNDLKTTDGMEARAEIVADIQSAQGDLAKIESEIKAVDGKRAEIEIEADTEGAVGKVDGAFEQITSMGGIAGGATAAAFVTVFNMGMERIQIKARFEDQFGFVKEDAERLGAEAGALYADGWGQSLEEVFTALGGVNQQLISTGTISEAEGIKLTEAGLAIAGVWGTDVEESLSAVRSMLLNGLAPSAEAATDILIGGLQDGANMSGDLYESIDEYSLHFGDWGIAADEMMATFSAGMLNGERDTDKLGDAVKEMRLRTLEDTDDVNASFAAIGLSADDTRAKIAAGGPAARTAFSDIIGGLRDIEDPIEQNRLAVALIGTQYEDMSAGALESLAALDGALTDTADNTDDLVENQSDATSEMTIMWRNFQTVLGETGEIIATIVNESVDLFSAPGVSESSSDSPGWFEPVLDGSLAEGFREVTRTAAEVMDGTNLLTDAVMNAAPPLREVNTAISDFTQLGGSHVAALEKSAAGTDHLRQTTDIATGAIYALADAERAMTDPLFAAQQATERYDEALAALNEEGGNTVENQRAVVEAAQDADYALLEVAGSADVTGESLYQMGLDAGLTEEQAYELAGQLMKTKAEADELEGEYQVEVDDDAAATEQALADARAEADLLDGKTVRVNVDTYQQTIVLPSVDQNIFRAAGGPVTVGSPYVVGEEGPELFTPNVSGTISTAGATAAMLANGATSAMSSQSSALSGSYGGPGGSQTIAASRSVNVNVYGAVGRDEARRLVR